MHWKNFTRASLVLLSGLLATPALLPAQGVRNDVILEIATGNWCYYCPGAALGADDLAASGAHVGIVEHHDNDVFAYASSDGRNTYYAVSGFPTAWFDGAHPFVSGDHTISMYAPYRNLYEAAIVAPTPFDLTASWSQNGNSIDVIVEVTQVGAYTGSNLRIQAALTESNLAANWQGMTEDDFVNRTMYPDHNGTSISTTQGGPAASLGFTMHISPSWVQQNMELVVWVEDSVTHEIFNGKMMPLSTAANAVDVALLGIHNTVPHQSCMATIAPEVLFRNLGADPLTAATFTYDVNGTPMTYNWTGNLPYYAYETITLPGLAFTPATNNDLQVTMSVPSDASAGNDDQTLSWLGASTHPSGTFMVRIKPDLYGSEITWDVKNSAGTVIASGGPYFDGNRIQINVPVPCNINDCFSFGIYDAFGDGIAAGVPAGWYLLEAPNGDTIFYGGSYGDADFVDWKTDGTVQTVRVATEEITVWPNPSTGLFQIRLPQTYDAGATITVWSTNGQQVYRGVCDAQVATVDLCAFSAGMYMLQVATEKGVTVQKLQKN